MTASSKTSSAPPAYPEPISKGTHHDYYYFDDGNLILQAGNTLFKIWDGPLKRHSKFFKEVGPHGADDEDPVVLDGVSGSDFEKLLWILYPPVIGQYKAQSADDWMAVLDLACRWDFTDIRDLAIKEVGSIELDPLQKIALQQKHDIDSQWAYSAYMTLCSRNDPLTVVEAEKLGIEATVKIFTVREKLERWGRKKMEDVQKNVCEVFNLVAPKDEKK